MCVFGILDISLTIAFLEADNLFSSSTGPHMEKKFALGWTVLTLSLIPASDDLHDEI